MCLICTSIEKDVITASEAWRNLGEMHNSLSKEHIEEVFDKIWELDYDEWEEIPWDQIFYFTSNAASDNLKE